MIYRIHDRLFQSGKIGAGDLDMLATLGITAIVNLVPKYDYPVDDRFHYLHVPFDDVSILSRKTLDRLRYEDCSQC